MLSLLLFAGTAFLLAYEGRLVLLLMHARHAPLLFWTLGFPLGAFLNALLFFLFTILTIPLTFPAVFAAHGALIAIFLLLMKRKPAPIQKTAEAEARSLPPVSRLPSPQKLLIAIVLLSIIIKLFYGVSHAVLLPTYYYDSLSQWTMRAQISYVDHEIAFDADEVRGLSKPQYPILLHSLQIVFMLPQGRWLDAVANAGTLMLTLSAFLALFLLLLKRLGLAVGTIILWMLLSIPLVPMHLGQGYGDIHVIGYLLLSAALLLCASDSRKMDSVSLKLSALFAAASAWVKIEGLVFGVVPWLVVVFAAHGFAAKRGGPLRRRFPFPALLLPIPLAFPWYLLLPAKGLPLSPHGTAFALEWHGEAFVPALQALFASGSFGIMWYVVLVMLLLVVVHRRAADDGPHAAWSVVLWGLLTFAGALFIYFFTPNVAFLQNGQTFSRTMLIPLCLLLLGCGRILASNAPFARRSDASDRPCGSGESACV